MVSSCRIHRTLAVEELENRIAPALTMVMNPTSDSGLSNADNVTNETMPHYTLRSDMPGYIYIDWKGDEDDPTEAYPDAEDTTWWERWVDAGTDYDVTPAIPLVDGYYSVNVLLTDPLGMGVPLDYTVCPTLIDTTPPDAPPSYGGTPGLPSLNLRDGDPIFTGDPFASDTGISATDNVTNITNPTFDVARLSSTPYDVFYRIYRSALGVDPTLVSSNYDGMGTIGSDGLIYRLFAYEDSGSTILVPNQETLDTQDPSAIGNPWLYSMRAVDLAGNESADGPGIHVWLDTTGPDLDGGAAEIDLMPESDSGIFDEDNYTNDYTPSFEVRNISASAASEDFDLYFRIYRFDVNAPPPEPYSISATPIVGDDGEIYRERDLPPEFPFPPWGTGEPTTIGHETLLDQQWPFDTPSENVYAYTVRAVDRAGNMSTPSADLVVTIDTLDPQAPVVVDLDASTDSGAWDDDNYTNVTNPRLNVTVNDESQDYWQLWRMLSGFVLPPVMVSNGAYVGDDNNVYRGSGDPFEPPWDPGSGYEILTLPQPDSVDFDGRPIPYLYCALAIDIAGNKSYVASDGLPVIIDTTPPPLMTLGDPRPSEPLPDEPIDYVPGETEPIHTNWPTFEWPYAMIPSGPAVGGTYDPTTDDCYLTTYWIKFDGGTGPEFEYDTRFGSNWNPAGYGPRPFGPPLPPAPQDDAGTLFPAPDIIYTLPTGGPEPWMLNRGLQYGFHTWQIRGEDLAGNVNEYSNAFTFLIDTFTDAQGDIIRLDVDRATLRNAGMEPVLTVLPTFAPPGGGTRPGTTDIASIAIAHTYDGSVLHFYIDPDNPNEPGIGPGDGIFTVGDVSSPDGVAVGLISVGIARDWTPALPGTFEGIGTFNTVDIGGNRLGALLISGAYDASAGQWVTVGGGVGTLGLFHAEDIVLTAPGGDTAILALDTKFVHAPHGHYWDAPGVPLAPVLLRGGMTVIDDGGGRLSLHISAGTGEITLLPMANGIGSVIAEIYLPENEMSATVNTSDGGDVTYVEGAGGDITRVAMSGTGEIDLLGINSNGGNIMFIVNATVGGDIFDVNTDVGTINSISTTGSSRIGAIYAGRFESARRVFPRHAPWPTPQDPPVNVPIGIGEDYFTGNGITSSQLSIVKTGEMNGADISITGILSLLSATSGIIDSNVMAVALSTVNCAGSVRNSNFISVGDTNKFVVTRTISDSSIVVLGALTNLNCGNGLINSSIQTNMLGKLTVVGPTRNALLEVALDAGLILLQSVAEGTNFSVGGNLTAFKVSIGMADSVLTVGGNLLKSISIAKFLDDSTLDVVGNLPGLLMKGDMTASLLNVGGALKQLKAQGRLVGSQVQVGADLGKADISGAIEDCIIGVVGNLVKFSTKQSFIGSQMIVGADLALAKIGKEIVGSRFEIGGFLTQFQAYSDFVDSEMEVGLDVRNLVLRRGITGGTVAQPNRLIVGGDILKAIVKGDISANTKVQVGGLPPTGGESDIIYMTVSGLIYGEIEVYGNLVALAVAGTAATPTGPKEGFTEAYLFNDPLGIPTGGRIDVGGRAMNVL